MRRSQLTTLAWLTFFSALIAYTAARLSDADTLRLVLKPLPVLSLAAIAALVGTPLARTVSLGLLLGASGDVLLELRNPSLFLPGLIAFLLGHVAYVVGFTRETRAGEWSRLLPTSLFAVVVMALVIPSMKEPAPIIIYGLLLWAMTWRASARIGHVPVREAWLGTAGAFLFVASDTLLAINRFVGEFPFAIPCILVTYWAAQALIVLSVPSGEIR